MLAFVNISIFRIKRLNVGLGLLKAPFLALKFFDKQRIAKPELVISIKTF